MEDKKRFAAIRMCIGLFLFYSFFSYWEYRAPFVEVGRAMNIPAGGMTTLMFVGALASLTFAAGICTRISAFLQLVALVFFLHVFVWLYSVELVHMAFLLVIYGLFARPSSWFSPWDCELEQKKIWFLPTFLVCYLGFSISGLSKSFYDGWFNGYVVDRLCQHHSPLSILLGTDVCGHLPARPMGAFIVVAEVLTFPLAIWKSTRGLAWLLFTLVNVGAYLMVPFLALVTTGMMIVQLFLFDPEWLTRFRHVKVAEGLGR
jgi:hypothetical protein